MTAFLYYVPGEQSRPDQGKLSHAFEGKPIARGCQKGPDGGRGFVYIDQHADAGKVGYYDDRQEWIEVPYLGCWIGRYKDDPPKESDLRRGKMLQGKPLSWRGEHWQVPVARSFQEQDGQVVPTWHLSVHFKINYETGEWDVGQVQEEYRPLWDAALKYWDFWFHVNVDTEEEEGSFNLATGEVADLASLALGVNYRVGKAELSMLELLSVETCSQIMGIVIDLESMDAILKKNLSPPESSSTDNGKQVETDDTPQPSLTG